MNDLLSSQNVVFRTYAFYSMVLVLKMFLMALLTGILRMRKKVTHSGNSFFDFQKIPPLMKAKLNHLREFFTKVFISPEDVALQNQGEVKYDDPDIERLRRAHLNDLENIPAFLVTGLLFVLSNPNELVATSLIRLYTTFRILHTVVYTMIVIRQPARSLMFFGGLFVNITMAILVIIKFFHM